MAKSTPSAPALAPLGGGEARSETKDLAEESTDRRSFYDGFGDSSGQFAAKGDRRGSMTAPQQGSASFKLKGK